MTNTDPRVTTARKLVTLAEELRTGKSFRITRLTVLKRLCAEWESAARFACYLADLSQNHFRTAPPSLLDAERLEAFRNRIATAVSCIHAYMGAPTPDADLTLRAAVRELQSAQGETRNTRWATVRIIHSRDALVVENAVHCILDPRNSAAWGYRLGCDYAERYDPRHGTGLVPESAPLVRDIAEFWLSVTSSAPPPSELTASSRVRIARPLCTLFAMPPSNPSPAPARRGRKPKPRSLDLRITIAEIEPPIWRLVRVPDAYTLHQLHRVIQLVFGWLDYHLYAFDVGGRRFEEPLEEAEDEDSTAVRLRDLPLGTGTRFTYTYDFGDHWAHEIVVEERYISTPVDEDEDPLPMLYCGARAAPREDCGGPDGHRHMCEALRDPDHPDHATYRLWANVYDPERFDTWMARNNLTLAAAWGAI